MSITTVHGLLEQQVQRRPDAIAVEHEGRRLTYRQLNSRANQLARYLVNLGVVQNQVVALCIDRSPEMVIGLLGIMKAGGAYLPLDPNYPRVRLEQMLEDAKPQVLIAETELMGVLPSGEWKVIALDREADQLSGFIDEDLGSELCLGGGSLVYVIYTSGSTGKPKGIAMHHRSMVNLIEWQRGIFAAAGEQRVLQFAALSFDVAFQEMFSTLCTGGTLILMDEWVRRDAKALTDFLMRNSIQRLFMPPVMLHGIAEYCEAAGIVPAGLRDVITAGEQLRISPALRDLFRRLSGCRLHNHYGPAETHVVTAETLGGDPREWPDLPPIGRPIQNAEIHIFDEESRAVRAGEIGEIYIGGACVSRGYLHQPALTRERFIPNPYSIEEESYLYRTGDLGRQRPDGSFEYLGRNDGQVKIRGFRVELAEIEVQLARYEHVKEVVVIAREDAPGEKRLVAYVTARSAAGIRPPALRAHLKELLPDYMVPSAFVVLDGFPLTPSGKVDRRSLPQPSVGAGSSNDYLAPQQGMEEYIAAIWQEILRVDGVGRDDDFFELGGHSLLAVQLLSRLRSGGLSADPMAVYLHPTLAEFSQAVRRGTDPSVVPPNGIPSDCNCITPPMLTLIELEEEHISRIVRGIPRGASNIQDIYPLAPLQEGMLFHHLLSGKGGDTYVIPMLFCLSSRDTVERFISALQQVIDRHHILRTAVLWDGLPQPVQVVYREARLPVEQFILQANQDPVEQLQRYLRPEAQRLELGRAPLMRLQIAEHPHDGVWYAVLQIHHLIGDHESEAQLLNEVSAIMDGVNQDLALPLPFRHHVARSLVDARSEKLQEYFRAKLGDVDVPTAAFGMLDVHGDGSDVLEAILPMPQELSERIRSQARQLKVSAAALFHASWALTLAALSGRSDLVFGTLILGRALGGGDEHPTLGSFINTLPVRVDVGAGSVRDIVRQVHRSLGELLQWERASLAVAQRCSGIRGSAPLFTTLLNYRYMRPSTDAERWKASGFELLLLREWTNYPIALSVDDDTIGFSLTMQTHCQVDPNRMLQYVHTAIQSLVEALERDRTTPALSLEVLPEKERWQVLKGFNATSRDYPSNRSVHAVFEQQVVRSPDAVAVRAEGISLTYAELDHRANRLAALLQKQGLHPGEYVPILLPRSLPMLVAQIAVLKCGGAYVPLDPETPAQRLDFILKDCGALRIVSDGARPEWIPASTNWVNFAASADVADLSLKSGTPELDALSPAYVMYTSGSTGTPKGVVVPHRAVLRLVMNSSYAALGPEDCIPHCSNPAFDASTFEVWGALLNGARVLIVSQDVVLSASRLRELLIEENATVLWMTVGLLKQYEQTLTEVFSRLRYLITGGDVVDPAMARRMLSIRGPQHFMNAYGPTECTTFSTTYRIARVEEAATSLPIGQPISNSTVYILNSKLQPVPIGAVGEIFIGGHGVALGYVNRPELTLERFLPDPFSTEPDGRMYRSGDLGRWRPDGMIEFLGRNDHQVKIRGFRIELGEIEAHIRSHPWVKEAVVVAREDEPGEKQLVCYVVPQEVSNGGSAGVEALRGRLREALPDYMVPSAIVVLGQFPLTANGKLDRRALPAPETSAYATRDYEAPRGEVEEALAEIWHKLLRLDRIGRHDSFFELGGNSLIATRVVTHVGYRLGVELPIRTVFEKPVLMQIARFISDTLSIEDMREAS